MSAPPDLPAAHTWLGQAHEDLDAARRLASDGPARVVCFLSHLAVEKAMKATLLAQGTPFRKVHDLFQLRTLLAEPAASYVTDEALTALNPWVIEGRYPGDLHEATSQLAAQLIEIAAQTIATLEATISSA